MGASAAKPAEPYKPIFDLELLGRCAGEGKVPGEKEKAAFARFRDHEAPRLGPEALRSAVEAVDAMRFDSWSAPPPTVADDRGAADRVRGALLGAALGDAAGLATEFLTRARVEAFYGPAFCFRPGVELWPDTHRAFFPAGDWTDDTDQMLLIVQSLLASGGVADQADFARRLKSWAAGGFSELGDRCGSGLGKTVGKVVSATGFEEAPVECAENVWRKNGMSLAANGAVMRAAACGFPRFWDLAEVERTAVAMCQVTHYDSRCVASCVCVAVAIACLLQGKEPGEAESVAIERALQFVEAAHLENFRWFVAKERTLDELELDEPHSIGFTFKALACGLVGLRSQDSFEDTLSSIIVRGGDADTNAVVCGALLGCARGEAALPLPWIEAMPYTPWLRAWSSKLLAALGLTAPAASA